MQGQRHEGIDAVRVVENGEEDFPQNIFRGPNNVMSKAKMPSR